MSERRDVSQRFFYLNQNKNKYQNERWKKKTHTPRTTNFEMNKKRINVFLSLRSCLLHFVSVAFFFWHSVALMRFERFVAMFIYLPSRKVFGFSLGCVFSFRRARSIEYLWEWTRKSIELFTFLSNINLIFISISMILLLLLLPFIVVMFFFYIIWVCMLLPYVGIPTFILDASFIYLTCFLRRFVTTYINNN